MWVLVAQRIFFDFLFDFVCFPLWWYTGGVKQVFLFSLQLFRDGNLRLAPGLWLKNIFVPMFGQHDLQGRLVSFFMRLVNFIGRSFVLLIWLIVCILVFCAWLILPLVVVYMFIQSMF